MDKCCFLDASGARPCARTREAGDWCYFHHANNLLQPASETLKERFLELIRARDGNWAGFVFPKSLNIEGHTIDFEIDLSSAQFGSLKLTSCKFSEGVTLSRATFSGPVVFQNCTFAKGIACDKASFSADVAWSSVVDGGAVFSETKFLGPVRIYGQFNGPSSWLSASFADSIDFNGGWIANISNAETPDPQFESHGLFVGETDLRNIDFRRPERARFVKVDLQFAYVARTDFRRVGFHDVTWATIEGRRAIYDEVWDKKVEVAHAPMLGEIEAAYRTIRICIEEGKDFSTASDFYVGEMQARRRQLPLRRRYLFSIEALYWLLSGYGCKPLRALGVLAGILGLHALLTGSLLYGAGAHLPDWDLAAKTVQRTFSLLSPLRGSTGFDPLVGWWFLLDTVFGALAVVQTALFGLALRGRIKRG